MTDTSTVKRRMGSLSKSLLCRTHREVLIRRVNMSMYVPTRESLRAKFIFDKVVEYSFGANCHRTFFVCYASNSAPHGIG